MDDRQFDSFARTIASSGSRRSLLKSALSIAVGALGFSKWDASASAGSNGNCNRDGKKCKKHAECCSDVCVASLNSGQKGTCCRPDDATATCQDKCGPIQNNCGQIIDCGSCCTAEDASVTCAGKCGPQINNCHEPVECEPCCVPEDLDTTCNGKCGYQVNNCNITIDCGECCAPDDRTVTCAGKCEQQIGNCGQVEECGICPRETCTDTSECAQGQCFDEICCPARDSCDDNNEQWCCPEDRAVTHACCPGTGRCCDCFKDNANGAIAPFYCDCPSPRVLCGTFPNDECCQSFDGCVDGQCVPVEYICPLSTDPTGANVNCQTGCCNGVCCPTGFECDGLGACVPQLNTCNANVDCGGNGLCTAYFEDDPGICCPNNRYYEHVEPNGPNGETILVRACCSQNQEAQDCPGAGFCFPLHYGQCSSTFRGSQPRVRP